VNHAGLSSKNFKKNHSASKMAVSNGQKSVPLKQKRGLVFVKKLYPENLFF